MPNTTSTATLLTLPGIGWRTVLLADNETKVDLLNNEAIAKTIVQLLQDRADQPLTVGVHGDWGAGKSSVLEMIEESFEDVESALCLKFNGWRFQGFEDAKIALIEGIVTGLIDARPGLTRASEAAKAVFRRIDWLKVAKRAGGLAWTAATGIPSPDLIHTLVERVDDVLSDPGQLANKETAEKAFHEVQAILKAKTDGATNVPEEINEFRKAFDELLETAGVKQLVVLIDDLDRCLPDIAIETLEAVRLFLFTSRTAFVVAADEAMIEYSVRKHFPDLPNTTGPQSYARKYLEKLIQVPFRIPALGEAETRIYVTLLLVGAALGEDHPSFTRLVAVARERLKQPWLAQAIDLSTFQSTLGTDAAQASFALTLSDQIGPILASGTQGNPRQIKRFLNSLELRTRTAQARGFGDQVKYPVLAKLMLAERFNTPLFDQIASTAAAATDGKCVDLRDLEIAVTQSDLPSGELPAEDTTQADKSVKKRGEKTKTTSVNESGLVAGWLTSPAVREWAAVQPPIGEIDLRPYLFIAKDRKDYFGATSILGHLASVVELLFEGRFAIQGRRSELNQLATAEAAQVFEAVRSRIVGGDTFDVAPAGIHGLAALVEAHPSLQGTLVDFLEFLPRERLGAWACRGWDAALTDPAAVQRFENLLIQWRDHGGDTLRAIAGAALRTRQAHT
jgi:predicted KAP-like P-loop ATPase